jgi:hypothetical protein
MSIAEKYPTLNAKAKIGATTVPTVATPVKSGVLDESSCALDGFGGLGGPSGPLDGSVFVCLLGRSGTCGGGDLAAGFLDIFERTLRCIQSLAMHEDSKRVHGLAARMGEVSTCGRG